MQINDFDFDIEKIVELIKQKFQNEIYKARIELLFFSNIENEDALKILVERLSKENISADYATLDKIPSNVIYISYYAKYIPSWSIVSKSNQCEDFEGPSEVQDNDYYYLSETDLRRKIKYAKNPLEKQRLERELGERNCFNRRNKATKKSKRRKKK